MKEEAAKKKYKNISAFGWLLVNNRQKLIKEAGIHATTISLWLHGHRLPSYKQAVQLAEILGVPLQDIPHYRIVVYTPPDKM